MDSEAIGRIAQAVAMEVERVIEKAFMGARLIDHMVKMVVEMIIYN